eukprot:8947217-Alexandrium_andersonii.AAC.1
MPGHMDVLTRAVRGSAAAFALRRQGFALTEARPEGLKPSGGVPRLRAPLHPRHLPSGGANMLAG